MQCNASDTLQLPLNGKIVIFLTLGRVADRYFQNSSVMYPTIPSAMMPPFDMRFSDFGDHAYSVSADPIVKHPVQPRAWGGLDFVI
jgi:hypothetical protein